MHTKGNRKETWVFFVHKQNTEFFQKMAKYFLSKWEIDISISTELPEQALFDIDVIPLIIDNSNVLIIDASLWLEKPENIYRFLFSSIKIESLFVFHHNHNEKEKILEIGVQISREISNRYNINLDFRQAKFIEFDNRFSDQASLGTYELLEKYVKNLRQKRVFISYASEDRVSAKDIADVLKEKGLDVWYDEWELMVGDSIVERINQGIRESKYMIVVLSKNSVEKPWCKIEVNNALNRNLTGKGILVLPALLDNCDIPPLLNDIKYADFRVSFDKGIESLIKAIQL
jgi:hypothetical protein